jgi:1,4-dihydroxy-2-naphthoate octaprenyltransferase
MYGGKEEGGGSLQEGKDISRLKFYFNLLKVGSKPINIAYPLPLTSFLAFSLSDSGILEFAISYVFCFFFFTAINLWNHVNDAEDDARDGREHAIFLLKNRRKAVIFVLFFYAFSALMISLAKDAIAVPLFLICSILTWIYSDKIFLGKKIRRFKEDYRTEILTYIIVTPSFALTLWTFFSPANSIGLFFATIFALLYISGVLLKDIKDYSADTLAGYKTLAVIAPPLTLFIISFFIFLITIFIIVTLSITKIIPKQLVFTGFMFIPLTYSILSIKKAGWKINSTILNAIKIYTVSYPLIILFMAILLLSLKI